MGYRLGGGMGYCFPWVCGRGSKERRSGWVAGAGSVGEVYAKYGVVGLAGSVPESGLGGVIPLGG